MNKRGCGAVFCVMAAMLYCTKYLAAAIYSSSNDTSWNSIFFQNNLANVSGEAFNTLNVLCLIIGIGFIIYQEYDDRQRKSK